MRTFLTSLGVFQGIFLLVILVGAGNALSGGIQESFSGFANNSAFVFPNLTSKAYQGFERGRRWSLSLTDLDVIQKSIPGIAHAVPRLHARWSEKVLRGEFSGNFNIYGDQPNYIHVEQLNIIQGRWLNEIDIREKRKVCVVGNKVLETLFEDDEDPMGQYIRIGGSFYQVVGSFDAQSSINMGGRKEETIMLPITTVQQAFNRGDKVDYMCIIAKPQYQVSEIEAEAVALLKRRHHIHPDDEFAVGSFNVEKELRKFLRLFESIGMITLIVGLGILFSGIVGVGNIMIISIKERTKTIGLQRAIGATPMKILLPILIESISLTAFAGFLGLSLGVFLLEGISAAIAQDPAGAMFAANMQIDIIEAIYALLILIVGGLIAGAIPGKRALDISPVDALRDE